MIRRAVPATVSELSHAPGPSPRRLRDGLSRRPRIRTCHGAATVLVPPGSSAWTLGRTVLVRDSAWSEDDRSALLVAHELVHVAQWHEQGPVRFLFRYLRDYAFGRRMGLGHREAYRTIEAEEEAYLVQADLATLLREGPVEGSVAGET